MGRQPWGSWKSQWDKEGEWVHHTARGPCMLCESQLPVLFQSLKCDQRGEPGLDAVTPGYPR